MVLPRWCLAALNAVAVAAALPGAASPQGETASAASAPATSAPAAVSDSCAAPEHRAFDFWLGEWEVSADGRLAGHNTIERVAGGCGLLETWRSARDGTGSSVNFYDPVDGRWHQLWVGSDGSLLRLAGGIRGDAMVLAGERAGPDGEPVLDRITWRALEDGTVRQQWEVSSDGGESWSTVFDGRYRRP